MNLNCPVPRTGSDVVLMAHGGGGRMAQRLLDDVFLPLLGGPALADRHDASLVGGMAVTTDAFVVKPWKFPGGDIGSLAVHGTVNDLAMAGAEPIAMTAAFILEEGFALSDLMQVVESMARAAAECGVEVAAGDTKVVERGKGDGVYIACSGFGRVLAKTPISPKGVREGDAIVVSGDVGRHGTAVMITREGLEFDTPIESDSAPVHRAALALIAAGIDVHTMRDCTRGGLATVLNEISVDGNVGVRIREADVPVREDVAGVCEMLGLDPLYVACEGRFVAFVPAEQADHAVEILRAHEVSQGATLIGHATGRAGEVAMTSRIGVDRVLDRLSGEQLPRIC